MYVKNYYALFLTILQVIATLGVAAAISMNENRLKNLNDKHWVGKRLQEFIESKGKSVQELKAFDDLSNLPGYIAGAAKPSWPALVALALRCNSDLESLMKFIDPATRPAAANSKHVELHRKLQVLLDALDPWPMAAEINVEAVHTLYQMQKKLGSAKR